MQLLDPAAATQSRHVYTQVRTHALYVLTHMRTHTHAHTHAHTHTHTTHTPPHVHALGRAQDLTPEAFVEQFERPRLPVVINGLLGAWGAQEAWTPEALLRRFGEHKFKVAQGLLLGARVVGECVRKRMET